MEVRHDPEVRAAEREHEWTDRDTRRGRRGWGRHDLNESDRSVGQIVGDLTSEVAHLARVEAQLAAREIGDKARRGAFGGGILPVLGRFGNPIVPSGTVIIDDFGFPGGAVGLGPAIVTDRASYYPDLPFVTQVDFYGFDQFGRPVFGPRESGNGIGDASVGTKIELLSPDHHPGFSVAIGGTVVIPTARNRNASALEPKGARPAKSRGSKK